MSRRSSRTKRSEHVGVPLLSLDNGEAQKSLCRSDFCNSGPCLRSTSLQVGRACHALTVPAVERTSDALWPWAERVQQPAITWLLAAGYTMRSRAERVQPAIAWLLAAGSRCGAGEVGS
jgi:hypothetical protein